MLLDGGLASLWTALPDGQYTYYLLFLNINYLYHTEKYLEALSNFDLFGGADLTPLDIEDKELKRSLPERFYLIHYMPDFYTNAYPIFVQSGIMVLYMLISFILLKFIRFPRQLIWFQKLLLSSYTTMKWGLLMRQGMSFILPISIAAFAQIHSAVFGRQISTLSMVLSTIVIFLLVWFLVKMFNLITYFPKTKLTLASHTRHFGTLWDNLRLSSFRKYYFWFVTLRSCLLSYVAVFITNPYIQLSILSAFQVFMITIFFKKFKLYVVFEKSWLNLITFIEEVLILIAKIAVLTFLILQEKKTSDDNLILIGWIIVVPGVLAQLLQIMYGVGLQVKNRRKVYYAIKLLISQFSKNQDKVQRIRRITQKLKGFSNLSNKRSKDL